MNQRTKKLIFITFCITISISSIITATSIYQTLAQWSITNIQRLKQEYDKLISQTDVKVKLRPREIKDTYTRYKRDFDTNYEYALKLEQQFNGTQSDAQISQQLQETDRKLQQIYNSIKEMF